MAIEQRAIITSTIEDVVIGGHKYRGLGATLDVLAKEGWRVIAITHVDLSLSSALMLLVQRDAATQ
jgi:hypothetical protein